MAKITAPVIRKRLTIFLENNIGKEFLAKDLAQAAGTTTNHTAIFSVINQLNRQGILKITSQKSPKTYLSVNGSQKPAPQADQSHAVEAVPEYLPKLLTDPFLPSGRPFDLNGTLQNIITLQQRNQELEHALEDIMSILERIGKVEKEN